MTTFKITFPMIEGKHYFEGYDTISHPLIVEAFKFGDTNNKNYNSIEWNGSIYQAELLTYESGISEVFVGEWLGDV